jgi:hypothetical protein
MHGQAIKTLGLKAMKVITNVLFKNLKKKITSS